MFRNIGDKVRVRFLGEVYDGKIVNSGGHAQLLYQVWLDNGKHTCLWFAANEVMDSLI
jgi:aromatic ring-cleaving dioxygenase